MLQKLSFAALFLLCGQIAFAQVVDFGKCPKVELLKDFEWPAYTGIWYEHSKISSLMEAGQKCAYANYTALGGDKVGVKNSAINILNRPVSIEGTAKIIGPGRLAVTFGNINAKDPKENYEVLGTDYKSWAAVYSCQNLGPVRARFAWLLTRERKVTKEIVDKAKAVFVKNGVSFKDLKNTKQGGCPALHE